MVMAFMVNLCISERKSSCRHNGKPRIMRFTVGATRWSILSCTPTSFHDLVSVPQTWSNVCATSSQMSGTRAPTFRGRLL